MEQQIVVEDYLAVLQALVGRSCLVLASGDPDYRHSVAEPRVVGENCCRSLASGNPDYKTSAVELRVLVVVEW